MQTIGSSYISQHGFDINVCNSKLGNGRRSTWNQGAKEVKNKKRKRRGKQIWNKEANVWVESFRTRKYNTWSWIHDFCWQTQFQNQRKGFKIWVRGKYIFIRRNMDWLKMCLLSVIKKVILEDMVLLNFKTKKIFCQHTRQQTDGKSMEEE